MKPGPGSLMIVSASGSVILSRGKGSVGLVGCFEVGCHGHTDGILDGVFEESISEFGNFLVLTVSSPQIDMMHGALPENLLTC